MDFLEELGIEDPSRSVPITTWHRPNSVEVRNGHLVAASETGWSPVNQNRRGLLEGFAALENASDDQIRRFAQVWGMLDLCGHTLPRTHTARPSAQVGDRPRPLCEEPRDNGPGESTEHWRGYASQASAFVRIYGHLLLGAKTTAAMWDPLRSLFPGSLNLPDERPNDDLRVVDDLRGLSGMIGEIRITIPSLQEARPALAYAVRRWMDFGAVGTQFEWRGAVGTLTFGGQSLFGALATLLAVTLSGNEGPFLCSHCRLPYNPTRMPRSERHFCETCREDGQPKRYARRAYNKRQQQSRAKQ